MLAHEEKVERIELIDAVSDAGRLSRGLDQLVESLAHADQLDPLDVEGILALRSISEKSLLSTPPAERERSALGGEAVGCPLTPLRFWQVPGIGAPLISQAR